MTLLLSSLLAALPTDLKFVNLGLPRSGTTWWHSVFRDELHVPSIHCNEPDQCGSERGEQIQAALQRGDLRFLKVALVHHHVAFADWPFLNFTLTEKLFKRQRVTYFATVRPFQQWFKSAHWHRFAFADLTRYYGIGRLDFAQLYKLHYVHVQQKFNATLIDMRLPADSAATLGRLLGRPVNRTRVSQVINAGPLSGVPHRHSLA
jgi:hypothetical protein